MNNNTYTKLGLMMVVIALILPTCVTLKSAFTITKSYLQPETSVITMGSLHIFEQDMVNQAYIESKQPTFITPEELKKYGTVILSFKSQQSGKQYRTAVSANKMVNRDYLQKIVVVLSSSDEVIAFNYVQGHVVKGSSTDITVDIQKPEKGVDHAFKVETQKKQVVAEESFFTKYKWPLIIGGVLLYLTMNGAGDKAAPPAQ